MMNVNYTFPLTDPVNHTNYYWFQEGFTQEELTRIVEQVQEMPFQVALTEAGGQDKGEGLDARSSSVKWIPFTDETKWIYDKIGAMAVEANNDIYHFDLHSMPEHIQYTEYYDTNKKKPIKIRDGLQKYLQKEKAILEIFDKNNDDFEHIISLWRPKDEKQGEQITGTWLHIYIYIL